MCAPTFEEDFTFPFLRPMLEMFQATSEAFSMTQPSILDTFRVKADELQFDMKYSALGVCGVERPRVFFICWVAETHEEFLYLLRKVSRPRS